MLPPLILKTWKTEKDNGLVQNRQQAIIWTNIVPVHWCIYITSLNELKPGFLTKPHGIFFKEAIETT